MNACQFWASVAVFALLAGGSAACSSTSTCSRDDSESEVTSGLVNEDHTVYVSAKYGEGPYVYFPPNRTLTFDVGLRAVPTGISILIGFSPEAAPTTAPSAGNLSLVKSMSADQVVLKNDTCSEFYVWLGLTTSGSDLSPVTPFDAGAAAAEGAAGATN